MAETEAPIPPSADDYASTGALFRAASERYDDFTIMRHKSDLTGEWVSHTWKDLRKMVDETAAALAAEGVERGDKVAILANSRMEWCVADLANFTLGAVTVPIYQSNLPDEVEYILDHSGAKIVFVEDGEQLSKVQQIRGAVPAVTRAIHDRYHPSRRNPYNEIECSDHYGRALAAYGVFLSACGWSYHGPKGTLELAPRLSPEDFRAPFTAAEGWGTIEQRRDASGQRSRLTVRHGSLRLREWTLAVGEGVRPSSARVTLGEREIDAETRLEGGRLTVRFAADLRVEEGTTLELRCA